jgi:hypothetical protein
MGRPYPVAASAAVELALVGPTRPATVVAASGQAVYLTSYDAERTILCVTTAHAGRVPGALVIESKSLPTMPAPGMIGRVGAGTVSVGSTNYRVHRWWRSPRPRGLGAAPPARLAGAVRWLTGRVADPLDDDGRAAVVELVRGLTAGARPDDSVPGAVPHAVPDAVSGAVSQLLGRGPGLTPTGDDVLAGALVCLSALGAPAAGPLAAAVNAAAPGATTTVSAALLRHATRGECIPQLADLLAAMAAGPAQPRAAGALLAVGHCSGAGLLHGVLVALAIAHSRLTDGVLVRVPAAA